MSVRKPNRFSHKRLTAVLDAFQKAGLEPVTEAQLTALRQAFKEAGVGLYTYRVRRPRAVSNTGAVLSQDKKTVYVVIPRSGKRKKCSGLGQQQLGFKF